MKFTGIKVAAAVAVALASAGGLAPAVSRAAALARDLGEAAAPDRPAPVSVTVALKLRDEAGVEPLIRSLYAADSPQYRQFLRPEEFYARFGPTPETLARVTRHFEAAGLQVTRVTGTHLELRGTTAAIEAEFQVQLHEFEAPLAVAGGASSANSVEVSRFVAPLQAPRIAPEIAADVRTVVGLDTRPRFHSHEKRARAPQQTAEVESGYKPAGNPLGSWTVVDFAKYYDVDPLYTSGSLGKGSTIGIVTFAAFTPSDAFKYWKAVDLTVSASRITQVKVDGGSGAISDEAGSGESTLDVEQSGGVAPAAAMEVYEAPNTSQGFVDALAAAIDANLADTLSCSWGTWEFFDTAAQGEVTDPTNGIEDGVLQAYNDLFAQAALQGQSVFIAAGDAGAYDETDDFTPTTWPLPKDAVVLSVDDPGVQQWVTDVGGTTLPGTQTLEFGTVVTIKAEQTWGWDYMTGDCAKGDLNPITCQTYPVGGGGGVSSFVKLPFYQDGIAGIQKTQSGQDAARLLSESAQEGRDPALRIRGPQRPGYLAQCGSQHRLPTLLHIETKTGFVHRDRQRRHELCRAADERHDGACSRNRWGTASDLLNTSLYGFSEPAPLTPARRAAARHHRRRQLVL